MIDRKGFPIILHHRWWKLADYETKVGWNNTKQSTARECQHSDLKNIVSGINKLELFLCKYTHAYLEFNHVNIHVWNKCYSSDHWMPVLSCFTNRMILCSFSKVLEESYTMWPPPLPNKNKLKPVLICICSFLLI